MAVTLNSRGGGTRSLLAGPALLLCASLCLAVALLSPHTPKPYVFALGRRRFTRSFVSDIVAAQRHSWQRVSSLSSVPALRAIARARPECVRVEADAEAVALAVKRCVDEQAAAAINQRGHFALAVPGGSVLKMLAGIAPSWAGKTTLAYVNHKCVSMNDGQLATHAKAKALFLKGWGGANAIVLTGSSDGEEEAVAYEARLRALPESALPRNPETGFPVFDLMLIGVGDDGHVGSLYPGREEVLETEKWVLAVAKKEPPSITLSLPVMAAARKVVIAACGVSDKYPQGKSDAMKRAIEEPEELQSFPAAGLRACAHWIIDKAAASKLSGDYQ